MCLVIGGAGVKKLLLQLDCLSELADCVCFKVCLFLLLKRRGQIVFDCSMNHTVSCWSEIKLDPTCYKKGFLAVRSQCLMFWWQWKRFLLGLCLCYQGIHTCRGQAGVVHTQWWQREPAGPSLCLALCSVSEGKTGELEFQVALNTQMHTDGRGRKMKSRRMMMMMTRRSGPPT